MQRQPSAGILVALSLAIGACTLSTVETLRVPCLGLPDSVLPGWASSFAECQALCCDGSFVHFTHVSGLCLCSARIKDTPGLLDELEGDAGPSHRDLGTYLTWSDVSLTSMASFRQNAVKWTVQDILSPVILSQPNVTFQPILPGVINISMDSNERSAQIRVLQPTELSNFTSLKSSLRGGPHNLSLELITGTDVQSFWTRHDPNGSISRGTFHSS